MWKVQPVNTTLITLIELNKVFFVRVHSLLVDAEITNFVIICSTYGYAYDTVSTYPEGRTSEIILDPVVFIK